MNPPGVVKIHIMLDTKAELRQADIVLDFDVLIFQRPPGHPVNWSWISSFIRAMNETALPIQRGSLCDLRMFNAYGGEVLRNISAIFCINRRNLETILEAAARLGLRIPEDLTVIGTDLPRIPDSRIRHIRPDLCRLADELVRWTDAGQVPEDWIGIPMELVSSEVYPDME